MPYVMPVKALTVTVGLQEKEMVVAVLIVQCTGQPFDIVPYCI